MQKLKFSCWDVKLIILSRRHCCMINIWFHVVNQASSFLSPPWLLSSCCQGNVAKIALPLLTLCSHMWYARKPEINDLCAAGQYRQLNFLENKSESDWNPDVVLATGAPERRSHRWTRRFSRTFLTLCWYWGNQKIVNLIRMWQYQMGSLRMKEEKQSPSYLTSRLHFLHFLLDLACLSFGFEPLELNNELST